VRADGMVHGRRNFGIPEPENHLSLRPCRPLRFVGLRAAKPFLVKSLCELLHTRMAPPGDKGFGKGHGVPPSTSYSAATAGSPRMLPTRWRTHSLTPDCRSGWPERRFRKARH